MAQQSSAKTVRRPGHLANKERLRELAWRRQKGKCNCKPSAPKREVIKKMETDSSQGCSVKGQRARAAALEILMGHKEDVFPCEDD